MILISIQVHVPFGFFYLSSFLSCFCLDRSLITSDNLSCYPYTRFGRKYEYIWIILSLAIFELSLVSIWSAPVTSLTIYLASYAGPSLYDLPWKPCLQILKWQCLYHINTESLFKLSVLPVMLAHKLYSSFGAGLALLDIDVSFKSI